MKPHINFLTVLLLSLTLNTSYADSPSSRPDSHAPIGVMGDHGHKAGEVMLSYRFMAIGMQGLQSGTSTVEIAEVLKDFMMAPTAPHKNPPYVTVSSFAFISVWCSTSPMSSFNHSRDSLYAIASCRNSELETSSSYDDSFFRRARYNAWSSKDPYRHHKSGLQTPYKILRIIYLAEYQKLCTP